MSRSTLGWLSILIVLYVFIERASWHVVNAQGTSRAAQSNLTMLWVYPTSLTDFGYSYSIDRGRQAVEETLMHENRWVQSRYVENVADTACYDTVYDALETKLNGWTYDMVIVGGTQFSTCIAQLLEVPQFAKLKVVHLASATPSPRVAVAFPGFHEVRFLHGLLCGQATETNVLGYVTAFADVNAGVARGLAAFVVGAQMVNPKVRVVGGMTGSFLDVVAETKATEAVLDAGADCIAQHQNDLTVNALASAAGKWSVGFVSDARFFDGENVLSSMNFYWSPIILELCYSILNDSWMPNQNFVQGFSTGTVSLTGYSTKMNSSWRSIIDEYIPLLADGSFNIFCQRNFNDSKFQYLFLNESLSYIDPLLGPCLNESGVAAILGIGNDVDVLVSYDANNSPYRMVWIYWSDAGSMIILVLITMLASAIFGTLFDVTYYRRNHPVYRAASPIFCVLILVGMLVALIAPIAWIGRPTRVTCMLPWWALGLGYTLILSCLIAKNWRIWRIFASGRMRVVAILNSDLLLRWVAALMSVEVLLLVLWTVFVPLQPKRLTSPLLDFDVMQVLCIQKAPSQSIGTSVFILYLIALLLVAAFISIRTRSVKEEYRESRAIGMIVVASIVLLVVIGIVTVALPTLYYIYFFIGGYGTLVLIILVYANIFLPKIWKIHFTGKSQHPPSSSANRLSTIKSSRYNDRFQTPTGSALWRERPNANTDPNLNDDAHDPPDEMLESNDDNRPARAQRPPPHPDELRAVHGMGQPM